MTKGSVDKFWSIRIVRVLMKIAGFWTADSETERKLLNGLVGYTLFAVACALYVEGCDMYFSLGDFYKMTYVACSTMPVILILIKVSTFMYFRKTILSLLRFTQNNFWYIDYDDFGQKVLIEAEKRGVFLIFMFTFFVVQTVVFYVAAPVIENIGKNETDRILPFNIWFGVPLAISPYFEIAFMFEVIALLHSGLCFCCFDSFLSLLNIHVAAQFKILGHRFENIFKKNYVGLSILYKERDAYEEFKKCILWHRILIKYTNNLKHIFTYYMMCQLLISSIMLCVSGFQIFLARGTFARRLIFIGHTSGCFFQLFVATSTANEVIVQSHAIGNAAYNSGWEASHYKTSKNIRTAIVMIILRSSHPCCLTAGGFFPVSLETFMAVLSTATSYFTLLRKFDTVLETQ